ncbi:olfactory receptor 13H1-like [Tachyglossus aculeatus]|uniref:olfactory receptor 13H1-like n=1 Tax=Tachyglossus aculeatus TaxID=9261 RepID=UPI0018F6AA9E|nr:olfactory receptor 13H1-like [Tachyglossus aculeatus]
MNKLTGDNYTEVTEFILVGFSHQPKSQIIFFCIFLHLYLGTVVGNILIIMVVWKEPRLHTPMYFFLCNLSFVDLCSTTTNVPLALVNCLRDCPTIPYNDCYAQMTISLFLGMIECCLLAIMAYDRFVAISNPLRYTLIMTMRTCFQIATTMWISNFLLALIPMVTIPARFCAGHNVVNHFVCELEAVLKLVCSVTTVGEILMLINSIFILPLPFLFILFSYIRIVAAILKIPSTAGRRKAFSTCGSHLTVVTIYYGTLISIYLKPQDKDSKDQDKIFFIFYGIVSPMMNPLIYTLRNKDMIGALRKAAGKTTQVRLSV